MSVCVNCGDGSLLAEGWKCDVCGLIKSSFAAPDGSAYRQLQPDDAIQPGDEFLLAGCATEWTKVVDSVGRTVREQRARDTNQAWDFRRSYPPNTKASDAR